MHGFGYSLEEAHPTHPLSYGIIQMEWKNLGTRERYTVKRGNLGSGIGRKKRKAGMQVVGKFF